MAKLDIIIAPDPRLKMKCKPVAKVDAKVARLMDDMLETMYAAPGIGLAAPQVGVTQRIIVLDVAREDEKPAPLKMANPELVWVSDEDVTYNEGCLSLPEHYADVVRPGRSGCAISTMRTRSASCRPRGCWRPASSMRWITSTACCSSTISPRSSATSSCASSSRPRRPAALGGSG